ncbi:MAG: hypothetical protein HY22_01160 [[Candidatus Thermochlorobacteriaceae] bacterium GBChlB]|nr:MAG: hypothetical protein HY22_01160 [[Candidatus Thermochlorobacteriaceae] bacterium GBChlB]
MPIVIFATPFFNANAVGFINALCSLPNVRLGVIAQEAQERLPTALRQTIDAHYKVDNVFDAAHLAFAAKTLRNYLGGLDKFLAVNEQIQVPVAEAREALGVEGLSVESAKNFRDKARMKSRFAAADIPCAKHAAVTKPSHAVEFATAVGFPLVLKPLAGAGSQSTFQIQHEKDLHDALLRIQPSDANPAVIEEFVLGQEHSLETVSVNGNAVWQSCTYYLPAALDVMRNQWIQWRIILPREASSDVYADIRQTGAKALQALGMTTGVSHLEWFRKRTGKIAISEVGARPPGAQIMTLNSRAFDIDFISAWARLMVYGEFIPPEQKSAAGVAFLRGQGAGRVKAVHGFEAATAEVGHLFTDVKLPDIGQPASGTYEGEGFVIVRHSDTAVVEQALQRVIELVRVELW